MLVASGIEAGYGPTHVLRGVDLAAAPARTIGLIGPNGSGKTTLLRTLYNSLTPRAGLVSLDGDPIHRIPPRKIAERVSVVAQESPSDVPLRVEDMVLLGRSVHRSPFRRYTDDDIAIAAGALERVGATHLIGRHLDALSGGEKQRVLIARTLAQQVDHLLLDEPTNHLDIHYQHQILTLIRTLGVCVVVVLHDINLAARYCDELVLLHHGTVVRTGTPQQICTPDVIQPVYGITVRTVMDDDIPQLLFSTALPGTSVAPGPAPGSPSCT